MGYDPTSDDAYDTPYDWDHIVPYSHLIGQGNYNVPHANKEQDSRFWEARYRYINSIGNLRLWPFWGNRSDSNKCHSYKLRMENTELGIDIVAKELGLNSTHDFLEASAIDKSDEQLWYYSRGEARDWPEERRQAWQKAVEQRVCYLYALFYYNFGFSVYQSADLDR